MVIKVREVPAALKTLNALVMRLSENHPHYAEVEGIALQLQYDYQSKKKSDHYLSRLSRSYSILHDIVIETNKQKLQIDTIIITSYGVFIVEVIHAEGTVIYQSEQHQIYLNEDNRNIKTYSRENHLQLLNWLQNHHLTGLQLHYFIVFPNRSTLIKAEGNKMHCQKTLAYADGLPSRIVRMNYYYRENHLPNNHLKNRLIHTLLKENLNLNQAFHFPVKFEMNDLKYGVGCPKCRRLSMNRIGHKWYCPRCDLYATDAHNQALLDYMLLCGSQITIDTCREYLKTDSDETTLSILKNSILKENRSEEYWELK